MNNMLSEFNNIFDTNLPEGVTHNQTNFDVVFLNRDDFKLNVTFWSNKINLSGTYNENECFFSTVAKTPKGERIGTIFFSIDISNKNAFLDLIEIVPKFRSRGIGRCLLQFMEFIASKYNISKIEGFYARDWCEYSEQFYNSCGYNIYMNESKTYEKVGKEIDQKSIYPNFKITNVKPIRKSNKLAPIEDNLSI